MQGSCFQVWWSVLWFRCNLQMLYVKPIFSVLSVLWNCYKNNQMLSKKNKTKKRWEVTLFLYVNFEVSVVLGMTWLIFLSVLTVKATVFDPVGTELSGERGTSMAFSGEGADSLYMIGSRIRKSKWLIGINPIWNDWTAGVKLLAT